MTTPAAFLNIGINQSYLVNEMRKAFNQAESQFNTKGINFKINESSIREPLGRITGNTNEFTKSLEAATARVVSFSATLALIGGSIRGFQQLVLSTIEVEKRMKEINSVFNLSANDLAKFSRDLFDTARSTAQTFDVASKAALEFSRQGLSASNTIERVAASLRLTRLSGLDVVDSVDAITTALNGFTREALTATEVVNKLATVDAQFAVSSKDLANALERVGSTAQDAQVGFDRLLGLITSARQITGRDGAVIGNALKSIFTRVQKSETLDQLEELGIAVRNLQGNVLPADQLLANLAGRFDSLTFSQQQYIAELTGGLFQINQLRALLSDLGRSFNIADQATKSSAASANEAVKRNEALNTSLSALVVNAKTTAKELAVIFGNIIVADPLKKILGPADGGSFKALRDTLIGGFSKIGDDKAIFESSGERIAAFIGEGLAKGLANVLTGPGAALGTFLAAKLATLTSVKIFEATKSLGSNNRSESFLRGTDILLNRASPAEIQRLKTADSVKAKEEAILAILERQAAIVAATSGARLQQASLFTTNPGTAKIIRRLGTAAEGYLPEAVEKESAMIQKGTGGANTSAKPVILPNFNFGGGKKGTVVANTDEYMVPNYANGGTAIFNKQMVREMGLPSGAIKIAAGGYVPNLAVNASSLTSSKDLAKKYNIPYGYAEKVFKPAEFRDGLFANPIVEQIASKKDFSQVQTLFGDLKSSKSAPSTISFVRDGKIETLKGLVGRVEDSGRFGFRPLDKGRSGPGKGRALVIDLDEVLSFRSSSSKIKDTFYKSNKEINEIIESKNINFAGGLIPNFAQKLSANELKKLLATRQFKSFVYENAKGELGTYINAQSDVRKDKLVGAEPPAGYKGWKEFWDKNGNINLHTLKKGEDEAGFRAFKFSRFKSLNAAGKKFNFAEGLFEDNFPDINTDRTFLYSRYLDKKPNSARNIRRSPDDSLFGDLNQLLGESNSPRISTLKAILSQADTKGIYKTAYNQEGGRKLTIADTESYLKYENLDSELMLNYIRSFKKGDGYKLFSKLVGSSKNLKKPITSSILTQPGLLNYTDSINKGESIDGLKGLFTLFPQLKYRNRPDLDTTLKIGYPVKVSKESEQYYSDGMRMSRESNVNLKDLISEFSGIKDFRSSKYGLKPSNINISDLVTTPRADGYVPNYNFKDFIAAQARKIGPKLLGNASYYTGSAMITAGNLMTGEKAQELRSIGLLAKNFGAYVRGDKKVSSTFRYKDTRDFDDFLTDFSPAKRILGSSNPTYEEIPKNVFGKALIGSKQLKRETALPTNPESLQDEDVSSLSSINRKVRIGDNDYTFVVPKRSSLNSAVGGTFARLTKKGLEIKDDYKFGASIDQNLSADLSYDKILSILPDKIARKIRPKISYNDTFKKGVSKISKFFLGDAVNFSGYGISVGDKSAKNLRNIEKYGDKIEDVSLNVPFPKGTGILRALRPFTRRVNGNADNFGSFYGRAPYNSFFNSPKSFDKRPYSNPEEPPFATGFIPSFAPSPLLRGNTFVGKGTRGEVVRSAVRPDLVFKEFKTKGTENPQTKLEEEFKISKLAQERGLPIAKVFGSLKRAKQRGGLFKEFVPGFDLNQAKMIGLDSYEIEMELKERFRDKKIEAYDLFGPNAKIRGTMSQYKDLIKLVGRDEATRRAANNAVVVDPGEFESFAGGFNPLADALMREKKAIDNRQIYIDSDPRLKSVGNPAGMLVANRRDEPLGGFQGVDRVMQAGGNPKTAGAAAGFIPSFATFTKKSELRTNINNAGFEGYGLLLPEQEITQLNKLFAALRKATDLKGLNKLGDDILAFTQKLDIASRKKVESSLGKAFPREADRIEKDTFAERIFVGGVNRFGRRATTPPPPPQVPDLPSTQRGGTDDNPPDLSSRPFLPITYPEKVLRKSVTGLSNKQLEALVGTSPDPDAPLLNRRDSIIDAREVFNQRAVQKNGGINRGLIDNVIGLSQSGTLKTDFFETVQREISGSGRSLSDAMIIASKNFIDAGGNAKQLKRAIVTTVESLGKYEADLKKNQASAKQNFLVNLASERIQQGNTLKPGSTLFNALKTETIENAKKEFRARIGKSETDTLTTREQRLEGNLINARVTRFEKNINPPDTTKLFEQLKAGTSIFGNFNKTAEQLIKTQRLSGDSAKALRTQATSLNEGRRQTLQTAAFAAPFILSQLSGFIPEGEGGTTGGKVSGGIQGAINLGSTGATAGGLIGGPLGAGIGAVLGSVIGGITGVIGKSKKSFEELARSIDNVTARNAKLVNATSQYIQTQIELENAIATNAKPEVIDRLIKKQELDLKVLSPEKQVELVNAGFDTTRLGRSLSDVNTAAQADNTRGTALSAIGSLANKQSKENIENVAASLVNIVGKNDLSSIQSIIGSKRIDASKIGRVDIYNPNQRFEGAGTFENKIKEFIAKTDLNAAEQADAIQQLEGLARSSPEVLDNVLTQLAKKLEDNANISPYLQRIKKSAIRNQDYSRELLDYSRQLESSNKILGITTESNERIAEAFSSSRQRIGGLAGRDENSLLRDSNQFKLASAERRADFTVGSQVLATRSSFIENLKDKPNSVKEDIVKARSSEDFARIAGPVVDKELKDKLTDQVTTLKAIEVQSAALVNETKIGNRLADLELRATQQAKLLNQGTFNAQTSADFSLSRVVGGLPAANARGKANAANENLNQIRTLDSLGLPRGEQTGLRERRFQNISVRQTLSELSSSILGERVGQSKDDLRGGVSRIRARETSTADDLDVARRIEKSLDLIDFNPTKELESLKNNEKINIQDLIDSKSISFDTGLLVAPLDNIQTNTKETNLILADLKLLSQQDKANTKAISIAQDQNVLVKQQQNGQPFNKNTLQNTSLFKGNENFKEAQAILEKELSRQNEVLETVLPSTQAKISKRQLTAGPVKGSGSFGSTTGPLSFGSFTNTFGPLNSESNRIKLPAVTTAENEITRASTSLNTFTEGFANKFKSIKESLNDFSAVGQRVASSLESSLGNAFGDFATGAKKGKDAFRDFAVSVLNDASRAFANKAVTDALGIAFGSFGVKKASGGPIEFARGGAVPALLTGGEFLISPQKASQLGKGFLGQLNSGSLPAMRGYAGGGMVRGGSGVRDDVPAMLPSGSYVIKKSSVNKYGPDYLQSLVNGRVQKRFWGGALIGAFGGAAVGYATGGKKGALYGAAAGAIGGGLYQNYAQTGSAFQSNPNAGMFSFSKSASVMPVQTIGGATAVNAAASNPWQSILANGGASALLGLGLTALQPKDKSDTAKLWSPEEITSNRLRLESEESSMLRGASQPALLELNPQGGYSLTGFGTPSTRRFASGGEVSSIDMAQGSNLSPLGYSSQDSPTAMNSNDAAPKVEINITINEGGQSSSETKASNDKNSNNFADNLGKAVEAKVMEVLTKERRNGGSLSQSNRR